nr:hypothetical protein CTI12_AA518330 [Tanacetum cinerariifolium]
MCLGYGHVVDSFIPNKRSINGKRFGFVRFINVFNKERLVNNLSTVWIGRHKLQANLARFERTLRTSLKKPNNDKKESEKFFSSDGAVNLKKGEGLNSYVGAVMNKSVDNHSVEVQSQPAFVLDEDCLLDYDYSLALMGKVSDFGLLNNLKTTLIKEGFDKFILKYLGGFWVLIEFHSKEFLEKFKSHVGVGSWFTSLEYASDSFYVDERVVWLDIEGIPMKAWTPNTFNKVSAKWGELIFVEDKENMSLNSKRICIKTKLVKNIFENCKIIIKRKVFWIRVKEVNGWVPGFMEDDNEEDYSEDDTSDNEFARDKSTDEIQVEAEIEDEVEKVSYTIFENDNELAKDETDNDNEEGVFQSEDPFNIYPILNKAKHKRIDKEVLNTKESLEFPPGFTPNIVSDKNDLNAEERMATGNHIVQAVLENQQDRHQEIKVWVRTKKESDKANKTNLKGLLKDIDRMIDEKQADQELINKRIQTMNSLQDLEKLEAKQQAIRGILKDGTWIDDPKAVKDEFLLHFQERFDRPTLNRLILGMDFPKKVNVEQLIDLERDVSKEEIKRAVWDCGSDKSLARTASLSGGNASFIALIPKLHDARVVKDFRPICLIGSVYKIVAKILANRLVEVLSDLVHEVQSAFIANRQILDGPFIHDELIHWCKSKKMQSMLFKVDFEKAYDSVRWDYLDDILNKFIRALHGNCVGLVKRSNASHSSVWRSITSEVSNLRLKGIDLIKFLNKKVGNGSNTSFWEEIWRGDKSFKVTFPRVFALESDKKIDVATKMRQNDLGFSLRRSPRDGVRLFPFLMTDGIGLLWARGSLL